MGLTEGVAPWWPLVPGARSRQYPLGIRRVRSQPGSAHRCDRYPFRQEQDRLSLSVPLLSEGKESPSSKMAVSRSLSRFPSMPPRRRARSSLSCLVGGSGLMESSWRSGWTDEWFKWTEWAERAESEPREKTQSGLSSSRPAAGPLPLVEVREPEPGPRRFFI